MLRKRLEEAISKFLAEKTAAKRRGIILPDLAEKLKTYVRPDGQAEYFIHFGSVKKLGIYMKSKYKMTPIGIYAYPLTEKLYFYLINGRLPFAQDQPYLVLFKPKNFDKILTFTESDMKPRQFLELVEKVENYALKNIDYRGQDLKDLDRKSFNQKKIQQFYEKAEEKNTNNEIFWEFTHSIVSNNLKNWTILFRKIGLEGIIDYGTSTIYGNEPTQAVFFGRDFLDVIDIFDNKMTPEKISLKKDRELIDKGYFVVGDIIKLKTDVLEFLVIASNEKYFVIRNKNFEIMNISQDDREKFELVSRQNKYNNQRIDKRAGKFK